MTLGLMTILAHPDDETFGIAGTFKQATDHGRRVAVVCATRGEQGEIANPALATQATLGQVREQELRNACAAVGVTDVNFLDYIDGHLPEVDVNEAVGRIVAQIRRFRPDVVITFAPNGIYGHVDHIKIHYLALDGVQAAADATRYPELGAAHRVSKVYYASPSREVMLEMRNRTSPDFLPGGNAATITLEEMGVPQSDLTTYVALTDEELAAKMNAMKSHATQMPADGPFNQNQGSEEMRQMMGTETFQLLPAPLSIRTFPTPETDVFAGLE